jgi:hypothetical protein
MATQQVALLMVGLILGTRMAIESLAPHSPSESSGR